MIWKKREVVGFLQEANGSPAAHGNRFTSAFRIPGTGNSLSFLSIPETGESQHTRLSGCRGITEARKSLQRKRDEYTSRHRFPGTRWQQKGSSSPSASSCRPPLTLQPLLSATTAAITRLHRARPFPSSPRTLYSCGAAPLILSLSTESPP